MPLRSRASPARSRAHCPPSTSSPSGSPRSPCCSPRCCPRAMGRRLISPRNVRRNQCAANTVAGSKSKNTNRGRGARALEASVVIDDENATGGKRRIEHAKLVEGRIVVIGIQAKKTELLDRLMGQGLRNISLHQDKSRGVEAAARDLPLHDRAKIGQSADRYFSSSKIRFNNRMRKAAKRIEQKMFAIANTEM